MKDVTMRERRDLKAKLIFEFLYLCAKDPIQLSKRGEFRALKRWERSLIYISALRIIPVMCAGSVVWVSCTSVEAVDGRGLGLDLIRG